MKVKYKARIGANFNDDEAMVIGMEIEKIKKNEGKVNPEKIIEYAKDKKSPLNKYFEWDTKIAAFQFNLQQARNLVNHLVRIVIIESNPVELKAFYSVHEEQGSPEMVYVKLEEMCTNKNYRKETFNKAIETLENLQNLLIILRNN
jgi:DNA-directed RNA polymerase subunit L